MPDPTAHADDMKSLAVIEPNTSPAFWWVNPWGYALNLKRALDAVHLLSEATEDAYQAAKASLADMTEDRDACIEKYQKAVIDHNAHNIASGRRTIEMLKERDDEIENLRAALDGVTKHRNQALKNLVACQTHIEKLEAKRKPAKKKAKYGDARDGYAALARKVLKGLAKKKGARRA